MKDCCMSSGCGPDEHEEIPMDLVGDIASDIEVAIDALAVLREEEYEDLVSKLNELARLAYIGSSVEDKVKAAQAKMVEGVTQKELAILGADILFDFRTKHSELRRLKVMLEGEA